MNNLKRSNIKRHHFLTLLTIAQILQAANLTTPATPQATALLWAGLHPTLIACAYLAAAGACGAGVFVRILPSKRLERFKPVAWVGFSLAFMVHALHGFILLGAHILADINQPLAPAIPLFTVAAFTLIASGVVDLPDRPNTREVPTV